MPSGQSCARRGLETTLIGALCLQSRGLFDLMCKRVTEGRGPEMLSNHALEDYEVERGYRLSLPKLSLSDTLSIDYDIH